MIERRRRRRPRRHVWLRPWFSASQGSPRRSRLAESDRYLTQLFVRAELPLPKNFTLAFEYQSTHNLSNIAVFDYTRNVYTVMVPWSY